MAAVAALGAAVAVQAQEAPASRLDPVVITGSSSQRRAFDAPYAIDVVDAATVRAAGPGVNLSESLARVPGLTIRNRSNYAQDLQISSRGFGARATFGVRGLRLYTDGIPATMPDGSGSVTHFDLASAQRLEVLRGPFSALYGNSSGGVIALFTAPSTAREAELGLDMGRYGLRQYRASVAAPLDGGWDLRAGYSAFETDGFRPHAQARRNLATARLGWRGEFDSLVLQLSSLSQPADDPLGLTREQFDADPLQTADPAIQFDTRKTARQDQLGLAWRHRFGADGALRELAVTGYFGQRGVMQWQAIPVAPQGSPRHPGGVIDLDRDYRGLDARLSWQFGSLRAVAGLNAEDQDEHRRGYENFRPGTPDPVLGVTGALRRDEDNTARTREVYAQADWALTPRLNASAGVRAGRLRYRTADHYVAPGNPDDSDARSFRYTNPVAGLSFAADESLNLYVSMGRGYEAPTLNELAYRADGATGFNTALSPMTSRQVEIGAKWRHAPSGLRVDAALFRADTRDEIGVLTNAGGRSTFQNVGRTRREGLELGLAWTIAPTWRAALSATWLNARYRDGFLTCTATPCLAADTPVDAGNRIAGTTARSGFAELVWLPSSATEFGVEAVGQSSTPANDLGTASAAGWGIVNLRALHRYRLAGDDRTLDLLARLDNAFDRRYAGSVIVNEGNARYFETASPRSAMIGLRLRQRW